LIRCGYRDDQIQNFNADTRLLQDRRLFGDNAHDELRVLEKQYGVDFSDFSFDKYFPGNFGWDHFVLTFLPRTQIAKKIVDRYPPITLAMIEKLIAEKKWTFE